MKLFDLKGSPTFFRVRQRRPWGCFLIGQWSKLSCFIQRYMICVACSLFITEFFRSLLLKTNLVVCCLLCCSILPPIFHFYYRPSSCIALILRQWGILLNSDQSSYWWWCRCQNTPVSHYFYSKFPSYISSFFKGGYGPLSHSISQWSS